MSVALKIAVGALAAIAGYIVVALWAPFGGGFDYASATLDERQRFLEARARYFKHGYRLTAGRASEITSSYADAEFDLVSFSVKMNDIGAGPINAAGLEQFRTLLLKTNCNLSERKLLTETNYTMRIRYFRKTGGKLFQVDVNGETCAPFIA